MMQHTTQDYEFLTIILFLIHTLFIIIAQKQGIIIPCFHIIVFRLVRDVVANHKTTRYAGAATKVIQKNHLA